MNSCDYYGEDEQVLICNSRFSVSKEFYENIVGFVDEMRPYLLEGMAYTASELLGCDFYGSLSPVGCHMAVLVLKHIVDLPESDLFHISFHDGSSVRFLVKSTF